MTQVSRFVPVRLHLTNVVGAGASQLLQSLLPALELVPGVVLERIELPERGELAKYRSSSPTAVSRVYRRILPNSISRLLECTVLAKRFDGESPLLVLGDLPLRCEGPQTLFLQQSNLLKSKKANWRPNRIKYALGRAIFKLNLNRVRSIIVQTDVMRKSLELSYPEVIGRVHIIPQPVPTWLQQSGFQRQARVKKHDHALKLIYPAAAYPHKNHSLLSCLDSRFDGLIDRLVLTLEPRINPAPHLNWVHCTGFLSPKEMIAEYSQADALLFLSKEESYGFPLVEAMFVGLPVVCPNLPYARTLCGSEAIYFDPDSHESLRQALIVLKSNLDKGWWPNWKKQLENIPHDWDTVARRMLEVTCGSDPKKA